MTRRLRPLSIHTRLTLWYTSVLCVILAVISALSYSLLARNLKHDVDRSLATVAQALADTSAIPPTGGDSGSESVLRELGPEFYDQFFQLFDLDGHLRFRSADLANQALPLSHLARENARAGRTTFETVRLPRDQSVRLFTVPSSRAGRPWQIVQVGVSLHRSEQALRGYLEILVVLVPLGLALAAGAGALLARTALAPIDRMTRTARQITADDLARRVELRGTGDELDRLAETLNEMLARLQATFAQIQRFAADAAHELRTPLTVLKGGLEVALRASRTAEEYREVLVSSLEEVDRLVSLAEDLLILSRASAGVSGRLTVVDLESLALEVMDVAMMLARDTGVSLRMSGGGPLAVRGDAPALRRAVINLVENAVKYTPAGGAVELSLARENGHALVVMSDTGPGIDPAERERVFQPFVRLDAARTRDTGGAGLGLAITRSIVVAHQGTITLDSAPGRGCRFAIRLPLEREVHPG